MTTTEITTEITTETEGWLAAHLVPGRHADPFWVRHCPYCAGDLDVSAAEADAAAMTRQAISVFNDLHGTWTRPTGVEVAYVADEIGGPVFGPAIASAVRAYFAR